MTRAVEERILAAAAQALAVLEGPSITVDGDEATMVARSILRAAFVDYEAIATTLPGQR